MKHQLLNLGARLRSLRSNAHNSQQALADACRGLGLPITRDMIASWETNRAEMPAQLIPLIAYALNAQVADLLPDLRTSEFADLPSILDCRRLEKRRATTEAECPDEPRSEERRVGKDKN